MKYLPVLLVALLLSFSACEQAPAGNDKAPAGTPPAAQTSNPEDRSTAGATAGPSKLTPAPTKSKSDGYRAFREKFPVVTLPFDFPWIAPEMAKESIARPFATGDLEYIVGSVAVKLEEREEAFHLGRFERAPGVDVLMTFIMGDISERIILTTHDSNGSIIANETIHLMSEESKFGYSSSLDPSFKIYRSEMFYVKNERSGKMVPEVDHEDIFQIEADGKITKE